VGWLAAAAIGYVLVCLGVFVFQRKLLYFPQPRQVTDPDATLRLPVDGAELVVTVRPHDGPRAIIYFGGNAEDVSGNLGQFGRDFPDHALYLMHYRGYGGSTGRPSETTLLADAVALFDRVQSEHPEIVLIGRSIGSGVAVGLAEQRPAARLVLITPFASVAGVARATFPWLPVDLILRDRWDSAARAPGITVPTTIIAAARDEVIPAASTAALRDRFAPGVASMVVIDGVGHNDLEMSGAYRPALRRAVE
jgi:pimeloyl-ACP methyl ester carboxylesterase